MDFIEEIDFKELQFGEIVGRGAFGVVSRARWKDMDVAVKLIETDSEKKAFITELTQLSRVNHPNIVQLYGACTKQPVCLVMEYAEGGSLYNVLHGEGLQPEYTSAHAISWCLQCARGVAYLHSIEPKALIHRDLKPPNLLLIAGGTRLKICDFGTACDAHTHMTNNKGSAAWMAPEVFEGSNYSEKCDVFSWGIILWEVITRRKPFDEIGGPAFRIMWAVHNGKRPPLIRECPKPLEILMTRCWSAKPVERPAMAEVVRIMTHVFQFFKGADEPLQYPKQDFEDNYEIMETPPPSVRSQGSSGGTSSESRMSAIHDTVRQAFNLIGDAVPTQPTPPKTKPVVVEVGTHRQTSAPASLATSRECLHDKTSRSSTPIDVMKRYSADFSRLGEIDLVSTGAKILPNPPSFVKRHRRTGSHDLPVIMSSDASGLGTSPVMSRAHKEVRGHRRTGSYGNSVFPDPDPHAQPSATSTPTKSPGLHQLVNAPVDKHLEPGTLVDMANMLCSGQMTTNSSEMAAIHMDLVAMDHQLQPLTPCTNSAESMAIFNKHLQLAQEYIRLQTHIRHLSHRKASLVHETKMDEQHVRNAPRLAEEYQQLVTENEQLVLLQNNMKKQVEIIRKEQGTRRTGNN